MPGYNSQRRGTARTLPKMFVLFYILFVLCRSVYCLCVNVYCTTATGWQPNCSLTNISYHINKANCYGLDGPSRTVFVSCTVGFKLYCGCFNLFCNVWVCVCVGVLEICVLVFTVFLCFVLFVLCFLYYFVYVLSVLV